MFTVNILNCVIMQATRVLWQNGHGLMHPPSITMKLNVVNFFVRALGELEEANGFAPGPH
jgi:hypothetical protein